MPTLPNTASPSPTADVVAAAATAAANTALETIDAIDDALRQGVHGLIADLADAALKPALRIRIIKALLDLRKLLLAPESPASFKLPERCDEPTPQTSSAKSPAPIQAPARDQVLQHDHHSGSAVLAPPTPAAPPPKLSGPTGSAHRNGTKRDRVVLNAEQLATATEFLPCLLNISRADPRAASLLESSGVSPAIPSLSAH